MGTKQCEHCGRPVIIPDATDISPLQAQVTRLEAKVDAIPDATGISPLQAQVTRLESKVDGVTQIMSGHPRPSADLVNIWAKCPDCAPIWNQVRAELSKQAAKSVHVKPSTALIQGFENCPECKEAWERMKRDNPELFRPKEPVQAEAKFFWEKERPK